jgi:hypothetical protein
MAAPAPQALAAAFADGSAAEREAAFCSIEQALRGAAHAGTSGGRERAVALAVGCARPLVISVLCAPASRVGAAEYRRASLLLFELHKLGDLMAVGASVWRHDEHGVPLVGVMHTQQETALAVMLAKGPGQWTVRCNAHQLPPQQ